MQIEGYSIEGLTIDESFLRERCNLYAIVKTLETVISKVGSFPIMKVIIPVNFCLDKRQFFAEFEFHILSQLKREILYDR